MIRLLGIERNLRGRGAVAAGRGARPMITVAPRTLRGVAPGSYPRRPPRQPPSGRVVPAAFGGVVGGGIAAVCGKGRAAASRGAGRAATVLGGGPLAVGE